MNIVLDYHASGLIVISTVEATEPKVSAGNFLRRMDAKGAFTRLAANTPWGCQWALPRHKVDNFVKYAASKGFSVDYRGSEK